MDEAKKAYESFVSFPSELWASITFYLYLDHLARLKLTGDTLLWSRLCSERAVKVINATRDEIVFKGLPAFIREFPRIEEMIIDCYLGQAKQWWENLSPKLYQMPESLKKLSFIGFLEPLTSDFFVSDDLEPLSLVEFVPHLEHLQVELSWSSSLVWMGPHTLNEMNQAKFAYWPPNLKSLTCSAWDIAHPLPSSLTKFKASNEIENSAMDSTPSEWSWNIPPSITDLAISEVTDSLMSQLPPSLTKFFSAAPLRNPGLLPQSVTHLDINLDSMIMDNANLNYSPQEVLQWPCFLEHLNVDHLPYQCWPFLPSTLTDLTIYHTGMPEDNTYGNLEHPIFSLPKSLKNLSISFDDLCLIDCLTESERGQVSSDLKTKNMIDFYKSMAPRSEASDLPHSKSNYFPPNLTKLKIIRGQLSPRAAAQLPPTLTSLHTINVDANVCKQLPRGITRLVSDKTSIGPELIKFLPRTVTILDMTCASSNETWLDYYDNGQVTEVMDMLELYGDHGFDYFPVSNLLWRGEVVLPEKLHRLAIEDLPEIGDSFFKNQKLSHLLSLDIPKAAFVTDIAIPLLSKHLTLLDLSESSAVSGASFEFLPRGLWYLSLKSSTLINDSHIPFLPPRLQFLRINSATMLTNAAIPLFPRTLEDIGIASNTLITIDSFPLLPPNVLDPEAYYTFRVANWFVSQGKATQG